MANITIKAFREAFPVGQEFVAEITNDRIAMPSIGKTTRRRVSACNRTYIISIILDGERKGEAVHCQLTGTKVELRGSTYILSTPEGDEFAQWTKQI